MTETEYQARLIKKIRARLPDCTIHKGNAALEQGTPDLTIFNGPCWAKLEVKISEDAPHQPNQDYYVDKYNSMSYAAFVFPENEEEVLNDLQHALTAT